MTDSRQTYDLIVIGGGASGLGVALEAVRAGLKILLLEQADFAKGTSSKSTKLIHGGIRYLAQGNISLVRKALKERKTILQMSPHLVKKQSFVIPVYSWWEKYYYLTGMMLYDLLAGNYSIGKTRFLNKEKTIKSLPGINQDGLKGGIFYYDAQFNDSRLAITLVKTIELNGGETKNYTKVKSFIFNDKGGLKGLVYHDYRSNMIKEANATVIVNATGAFVNGIQQKANVPIVNKIIPSRGTHIVVDSSFLSLDNAVVVPKTKDGRIVFAVPWEGKLLIGTTDIVANTIDLEPVPTKEEIKFIIETINPYLNKEIDLEDIRSAFAGLRPLSVPLNADELISKNIDRGHYISHHINGLVSVTGGKWTTFRLIGEDVVKYCFDYKLISNLKKKHIAIKHYAIGNETSIFGKFQKQVDKLIVEDPRLGALIHPDYTFTFAEIIWCTRNEKCFHVEDFLARRIRLLFFDAKAAIDVTETVARTMAKELNKGEEWVQCELEAFRKIASKYCVII